MEEKLQRLEVEEEQQEYHLCALEQEEYHLCSLVLCMQLHPC